MEASEIPQDVCDALAEKFKGDDDNLARIIFFLSDALASDTAHPYIRALQQVIKMPAVFKKVAERIAEDTKTADKDPNYKQLMYDVWNNFLKDGVLPNTSGGQGWDLAIPSNAPSASAQFAFMRAVSRLPPEAFSGLQQVVQSMSRPLAHYTSRAQCTARQAMPVVRVALVAVFLAYDVLKNIKRWWNGEITGTRCVKNILDCGVSIAAGLAGGIGGEMIGAGIGAVGGPVGMAIGAVIGGVAGGIAATVSANALCDRLTQWAFGLPKTEALENAYNFLAISPKSSNSDINSRFRHLSLKYHPDKGGNRDDWTRLQYSMAVIREARGEV